MGSREYEQVKGELTVAMISKEASNNVGDQIPKVPMGDMSLIYQLVKDNGRRHTVTYTDLMNYRITATQLHQDAFENAQQTHPALVQTLEETLGLPPNMHPQVPDMYVVTNTHGELGAAVILYPGMMEELAEKCGGDYVILPSSVHEMLVVRAEGADLGRLESMLRQINHDEVAPHERLSNNIYCYDGQARMVMKASVYEQLQAHSSVLREYGREYGDNRGSKHSVRQSLQENRGGREPAGGVRDAAREDQAHSSRGGHTHTPKTRRREQSL